MQVVEQNLGSFGRIGKALGQGLSEQLPKEVERMRLSSGLKKLGEKATNENLSPLQIFTEAAGIPGITPQHLYTMAPILNQQIQKQNFLKRGGEGQAGTPGIGGTKPGAAGQNIPSRTAMPNAAAPDSGFVSPDDISNYKSTVLQEPGFEQINSLAKDYINQGITQDSQEASKLAAHELAQNRSAQAQRVQAFKDDFGGENGRFALQLQSGPLGGASFKAVAGEIQQALLDQGEYRVGKLGMNPAEVAQQMSDIALELGKTIDKTNQTGSFMNQFTSKKGKITDLRAQKEDFEKYGFGEQFNDIASSALGITPLEAGHILSPLENKTINNTISNTKKISQKSTENNIDPVTLDKIIKSITPKDNLFSIEYLLRDKQLDIQQFKRRVQELQKEKEISLTPEQRRQMKRSVSESFLGDLIFEAL